MQNPCKCGSKTPSSPPLPNKGKGGLDGVVLIYKVTTQNVTVISSIFQGRWTCIKLIKGMHDSRNSLLVSPYDDLGPT